MWVGCGGDEKTSPCASPRLTPPNQLLASSYLLSSGSKEQQQGKEVGTGSNQVSILIIFYSLLLVHFIDNVTQILLMQECRRSVAAKTAEAAICFALKMC